MAQQNQPPRGNQRQTRPSPAVVEKLPESGGKQIAHGMTMRELWILCNELVRGRALPGGVDTTGKAIAIALASHELRLPLMYGFRNIYMEEGSVGINTDLMKTLILRAGHKIEWPHRDTFKVVCRITRGDTDQTQEAEFTHQEADEAGLLSRWNWKKYEIDMLAARALGRTARLIVSDAISGCYLVDEIRKETSDERAQRLSAPPGATQTAARSTDAPSGPPEPTLEADPDALEAERLDREAEAAEAQAAGSEAEAPTSPTHVPQSANGQRHLPHPITTGPLAGRRLDEYSAGEISSLVDQIDGWLADTETKRSPDLIRKLRENKTALLDEVELRLDQGEDASGWKGGSPPPAGEGEITAPPGDDAGDPQGEAPAAEAEAPAGEAPPAPETAPDPPPTPKTKRSRRRRRQEPPAEPGTLFPAGGGPGPSPLPGEGD